MNPHHPNNNANPLPPTFHNHVTPPSQPTGLLASSSSYGIAGARLSEKWLELVKKDQVAVTTTLPRQQQQEESDAATKEEVPVRYGVRLHPSSKKGSSVRFMEFVESAEDNPETAARVVHPKIATINATLEAAAAAALHSDDEENESSMANEGSSSSLQVRHDGDYVAQLQLVRTLRPPPSPGFGSTTTSKSSSSTPPPYDAAMDSFVTGPLRLQLRPLVATLTTPASLNTAWDVFHNVSPCDTRGHYLLLPTLRLTENWRAQALTQVDCHDLVWLASTIFPVASLLLCFNSVGAGASQNHIHCHLWPCPPVPLFSSRRRKRRNAGWSCYAASRTRCYDKVDLSDSVPVRINPKSDRQDENKNDKRESLVQVRYLDYPCFCVQLSSVSSASNQKETALNLLGTALWNILGCLGDAPHNVCMINRPFGNKEDINHHNKDDAAEVDVYVFVRSRERSPTIVPSSKLGASEMMGVFHCQSLEQLEELVPPSSSSKVDDNKVSEEERQLSSPMMQALKDVSYDDGGTLWETIKEQLAALQF